MIVFRLGDLQPDQVYFGFSPAQEALHSMRVLYEPKRYPLHIDWVLRTRKKLSSGLKTELESFRETWSYGHPLFWDVRETAEQETFAEQWQRLRELPVSVYIDKMLGATLRTLLSISGQQVGDIAEPAEMTLDTLAAHMPWLEQNHPKSMPFYRDLLRDAEANRNRFADVLGAYWEAGLEEEWERIEGLMVRDIERRAQVMFQRGVIHGLVNLSRYMHANIKKNTCVITYRKFEIEVELDTTSTLHLTPSYFTWPFLLVSPTLPNALIAYPLMQQQQEAATPVLPERLLQLLKATSDMTRLQILQLIAKKPRSTRELAGMIGVAEATASKHLKQLLEAQLVTTRRDSHYVFYELLPGGLEELSLGVANMIRQ
ncbi:MAG: DUF5937 family protein [Tumebacillaceae bacterium]